MKISTFLYWLRNRNNTKKNNNRKPWCVFFVGEKKIVYFDKNRTCCFYFATISKSHYVDWVQSNLVDLVCIQWCVLALDLVFIQSFFVICIFKMKSKQLKFTSWTINICWHSMRFCMVLDAQLRELPSQSQSLNQCEKVNAIFFVHIPHDLLFLLLFLLFLFFLLLFL